MQYQVSSLHRVAAKSQQLAKAPGGCFYQQQSLVCRKWTVIYLFAGVRARLLHNSDDGANPT
jgi:hypothetical protein